MSDRIKAELSLIKSNAEGLLNLGFQLLRLFPGNEKRIKLVNQASGAVLKAQAIDRQLNQELSTEEKESSIFGEAVELKVKLQSMLQSLRRMSDVTTDE